MTFIDPINVVARAAYSIDAPSSAHEDDKVVTNFH